MLRLLIVATLSCCVHLVAAQTLCVAPERTYFFCRLAGSGRTISVCGNVANGEIQADSWLQYRVRVPGRPIEAWPAEKQDSISKFEGNVFVRYDVVDLRFVKGDSLFGVQLAPLPEAARGGSRPRYAGSVSVEARGRKAVMSQCAGSTRSAGHLAFEELNVALRQLRGDTDLASEFYAGRPAILRPR